jgi:hypothetical protein
VIDRLEREGRRHNITSCISQCDEEEEEGEDDKEEEEVEEKLFLIDLFFKGRSNYDILSLTVALYQKLARANRQTLKMRR